MLGMIVLGLRMPELSDALLIAAEVWFVVCGLVGVVAIVVAAEDFKAPKETEPRYAEAGLVLGAISAAFVAIGHLLALLFSLSFNG